MEEKKEKRHKETLTTTLFKSFPSKSLQLHPIQQGQPNCFPLYLPTIGRKNYFQMRDWKEMVTDNWLGLHILSKPLLGLFSPSKICYKRKCESFPCTSHCFLYFHRCPFISPPQHPYAVGLSSFLLFHFTAEKIEPHSGLLIWSFFTEQDSSPGIFNHQVLHYTTYNLMFYIYLNFLVLCKFYITKGTYSDSLFPHVIEYSLQVLNK